MSICETTELKCKLGKSDNDQDKENQGDVSVKKASCEFVLGNERAKSQVSARITSPRKSPRHLKIGGPKAFVKKVLTVYKMALNSDELQFKRFIFALQKLPEQRSLREIAVIKTYLESTDLSNKFQHDSTDEELLIKILYFCSMHVKYIYLGANKTLFRIGDIGDKFFLILKGTIGIFKPISRTDKLKPREYIDYLVSLRDENERFLLTLTINANIETYPVDINDIEEIEEISFKISYRRMLLSRPKTGQIRQIFENFQIDPKIYHLDLNELFFLEQNAKSSDQYFSQIQKQLRMVIESNNFSTKIEYYKYLENESVQKFVSLFFYNHCLDLSTGKYFGDYALDQKTARTATIKTMEDTHFGYLEVNHYNEFLEIERQKMHMKEMSFLTDNFFFTPVNKKTFEEKYFQLFVLEDHFKGELLFKENDTNEFICFIKAGEVELGITKSAYDIHYLLSVIEKKNAKGVNVPWGDCLKLKSDPKFRVAPLNKKKCIKLFYTGTNEILGIESFYAGVGCLFHAKVISEKLKLYKIEYKNLHKILQDEKDCMRSLENCAINKLDTYIRRVITIMNSMLRRIASVDASNLEEVRKKEGKKNKYPNEFTPKLKTFSWSTHTSMSPNPKEMKNNNYIITEHPQDNTGDYCMPQQVKIHNEKRKSYHEVMPLINERACTVDPIPKPLPKDPFFIENQLMNQIKKELNVFQKSSLTQFNTFWGSQIKTSCKEKNSSGISLITNSQIQKSSAMPSLTEEALASPKNFRAKSRKNMPMINFLKVIGKNVSRKNINSKLSMDKKTKFSYIDENNKTPRKTRSTSKTKGYLIGNDIFSNSTATNDNFQEDHAIVSAAFHSRKGKISSKELLEKAKKNADYKKAIREKANLIKSMFGSQQ